MPTLFQLNRVSGNELLLIERFMQPYPYNPTCGYIGCTQSFRLLHKTALKRLSRRPPPLDWLFLSLFSLVVTQPFNIDDHLKIVHELRPDPLCRLNTFRAITWPNPASHKVQVQIDRSNPFRGGIGKS